MNNLDKEHYAHINDKVDPSLIQETLEILHYIENRGNDIVNWDERIEMEKAYMRSGHVLSHLDENEYSTEKPVSNEPERYGDNVLDYGLDLLDALGEK